MNPSSYFSSRRRFLKQLTATTAAGIAMPNLLLRAQDTPASKRVAVGCIGVGASGWVVVVFRI